MGNTTGQQYFLVALLAAAFLLTAYLLFPFFAPLVLGVVFAVVLQPLYRRFCHWFGGRESLASLATVVVTFFLILIPLFFIGFQILSESQQLYNSYSDIGIAGTIDRVLGVVIPVADAVVPGSGESIANISVQLDSYVRQGLGLLVQHLGDLFSGLAAVFLALFIFFITLYYVLRDGRSLLAQAIELSPLANRDDRVIFDRLDVAVNSVIKGMLSIAFIQGLLTGLGFWIFGVPNPVLWGLVAALAAMIPAFGTALVIAPAVAYLALTGDLLAAAGLAVWGSVAVGMIDNFLSPYFMSRGMKLHPLLVLLSVLGGIMLFGPVGIFLGPLTVSFLLALLSLYTDFSQKEGVV